MIFTEKEESVLSRYHLGEQLDNGRLEEAVVVEEFRCKDMELNFLVIGSKRINAGERLFEVVLVHGDVVLYRTFLEEYVFDRLEKGFGLERVIDFDDKITVGDF